ncbi:AATF protein [Novymonas esmeraldas]|uniref:AATF protein n=1 Tax=Novymonas esmeraldas TaxID=1808958 RepID=A0AAW0EPD7_9TRYP
MPRFSASSGRQTVISLRQKRRSLAEEVNEQLTQSVIGGGGIADADEVDGGVAEEYEFDDVNEDGEADGADGWGGRAARQTVRPATLKGKAATTSKRVAAPPPPSSSSSRLRHRGPLDASLSEGKYAAAAVDVEAAMDDIFGALDMGDMDAEGEEIYSDVDGSDAAGAASEEGDDEDDDEDDGGRSSGSGSGSGGDQRPGRRGDTARGAAAQAKDGAGRKRRRAKDLTEEEYAAWLEKKSASLKGSRRPLSFSGDGSVSDAVLNSEEADVLRQLGELRQTQMSLVPSSADAADPSSAAAAQAQSDGARTRDAVQHLVMVYGQLLRLRVLLQPAVTKAVCMPQYYALPLFTKADADVDAAAGTEEELDEMREAASKHYSELRGDVEQVLATLYGAAAAAAASDGDGGGGSTDAGASRRAKRPKAEDGPAAPSYREVERYHERVLRHADTCLEYWGGKLVQANSAKLKTIAQPLPLQIAAILSAKSRLRSKVQKNRSHIAIMAHPAHVRAATSAEAKAQRALHIAEGDMDAEVYDDADFLRELVRRGGAVASQLEQKVKEMQRELLPSRDGARKGFHRMTKGKAVNYDPRPKLVGFMMAEPLDDTHRNDVVVKNLFQ